MEVEAERAMERSPGRVTRRRLRTRATLLDAAFAVFAAKGYGRVSIEEVSAAAGYSRGAFYSNFATLDELFFALYRERADVISGQIAEGLTSGGPDLDVATAIDVISDVLLLDLDWLLIKTDFVVHAAREAGLARTMLEHRLALQQAIADRLACGRGETPVPAVLTDVGGAARAVVAAYDGVTLQLILDRDVARARHWLKQLLRALLTDGSA